ncbi:hypothetical protein Tco_1273886, partial [Tanacetum coccineum]
KDEEAADVDVHLYRSMIGSLMYLTASRPDIMFAVCACSRFQENYDNHDLSRLDNQSIERDRLIRIGFVLNFVKFILVTFGDKEMILVIEAVSR